MPAAHTAIFFTFCQKVGYTSISSKLPADRVLHLLERLYLAFDKLVEKYKLFKVETVCAARPPLTLMAPSDVASSASHAGR